MSAGLFCESNNLKLKEFRNSFIVICVWNLTRINNVSIFVLQETIDSSKQRRVSMKSSEQFWKRQHTDSSAMENWVLARQRVGKKINDNKALFTNLATNSEFPFS